MEADTQPSPRRPAYWAAYSVAERDRRWQMVRERAATAGLDCIFVPLGNGSDGRYLTQFQAACIVLPTDGRQPIVMVERLTERGAFNDWVPEPRIVGRGQWPVMMTAALTDLGLHRARIGVVGLTGGKVTHARAPDGSVNHGSYAAVVERLAHARFEDATDVVGLCRYVKSDEELGWLRRSAGVAEAGLDALLEATRPGAGLSAVYAAVMARMLELGSEYQPLAFSIADGRGSARLINPPRGLLLESRHVMRVEINAALGGQIAQIAQQIFVGRVSDEMRQLVDAQFGAFELGLSLMKPGTRLGDLIDAIDGYGVHPGVKTLSAMQGCGYGDDGPWLAPDAESKYLRDVRIEMGNALIWKPVAMTLDGALQVQRGGPVLITETGAELLFQRRAAIDESPSF